MSKTVQTHATWKSGMRVDVQAGEHTVIVDQPEAMGGNDEGANPMEVLLFALGSCLGTVAAIVAMQEQIDLQTFEVDLEGDFDPAFIMGKTTAGRAGFTAIRASVKIEASGLSEEEKLAFLDRVDKRCPITDNLMNNTRVLFALQ